MIAQGLMLFGERRDQALGRSFALAALVHLALVAVMFLGVRWQIHPAEVVSVELWEAPPPRPAPVLEAPKPPPPKPQPEVKAEIKKPDIVEKVAPKPKPKAEPKPKPEAKPKPIPNFEKNLREQMAAEQKALNAERQERELKALLARQQADANARARNEYIFRIQSKVKSNWILPQDLKGNPEAVFDVVQLPTGEVLSARIVKSSGIPSYDAAVERAILKSSPLPPPPSRELFARELRLTFRPQDK